MVETAGELNKIRWRSRRGMAELLFLSEARQAAYVRMLGEEDPVLWEWFSERTEPEDEAYLDLVRMMLRRVQP